MKKSPLAVLFVTVLIDLLGFGIIIPLQPFYAKSLGADGFTVGLLSASYSFAQFFFAPFWGRLSDRIGRRPVLRASMVIQALGFLLFGLADDLTVLFAARILAGVGGANISAAQAYIADVTTPENRAKGMGMIGAAFGLGFVLGPALAGVLSRAFNPSVPAFVAAGLCAANFLVASRYLPESLTAEAMQSAREKKRGQRLQLFAHGLKVPRLGLLWILFFANTLAFSAFEPTFALYANWRYGYDEATVGYIFAYVGVVLAITQGVLVGRLARKLGEERLVYIGMLMLGGAIALLPHSPTPLVMMVVIGVLSTGSALLNPSTSSLISKASPFEFGAVLGVSQGLGSLARALGPAIGGKLYDLSPGTHVGPFHFAGGLLAVSLVAALVGLRRFPESRPSAVPVTETAVSQG